MMASAFSSGSIIPSQNVNKGKAITTGVKEAKENAEQVVEEALGFIEEGFLSLIELILSPIFTISNSGWTGGLSNVLENAFNGLVNLERHEIKNKMDTFLKEILNVVLLPLYLIRLFISVIRLHPIIDILTALVILSSLIGASVPALLLIGYAPQYLYRLSSKTFFALL